MRTIMVLNAKGGCGKSTISTNLASYYAAVKGKKVVLADYDPQGSSMAWLAVRDEKRPEIYGVPAFKETVKVPRDTDIVIMDAPARTHGKELTQLISKVQTIIFPVLPSPIDMRAASDYMKELQAYEKIASGKVKVGVVANRVREYTNIFLDLYNFLNELKVPYIATLRDTQNYIRAEARGVGVYEMAPSAVEQDIIDWTPLIKWLESKRSQ